MSVTLRMHGGYPAPFQPCGLPRKGKLRKEFWLNPKLLKEAQGLSAPPPSGRPPRWLSTWLRSGASSRQGRRRWRVSRCAGSTEGCRSASSCSTPIASSTPPGRYLSAVVAAELRAGARNRKASDPLEKRVLAPYLRRCRILTPTTRSWEALGRVLAVLEERDGLSDPDLPQSTRSGAVREDHSLRQRAAVSGAGCRVIRSPAGATAGAGSCCRPSIADPT